MTHRVEICGGIASGKTTLCALLEGEGLVATYEDFSANPFWELFYQNPKAYGFETETTFLLQHYSQIKAAIACGSDLVCDFALLQDQAYADLNLEHGQLDAFCSVYRHTVSELLRPSVLVHLDCTAEEELARVRNRARSVEAGMKIEYLDALNRSVKRRVSEMDKEVCVLTIDSVANDFAHDAKTQQRVVGLVLRALRP